MKYPRMDLGKMEAVINKLGGMEGVEKFLGGKMTPQEFFRLSYEEYGIIYFSVFSFGRSAADLLERLRAKKFLFHVEDPLITAIVHTPTVGLMSNMAVIRADRFEPRARTMNSVRALGKSHNFLPPTLELLLLTCDSSKDGKVLPSLDLDYLGAETPAHGTFVVDKFGFNGGGRLQKVKLMCEDNDEVDPQAGFLYLVSQTPFETK